MKWLKWIIAAVAVTGIIVLVCCVKYERDWEKDFSEYSSGLLRGQAYYVFQPVANMINEEQMLIGQSESEESIYYYSMVNNGDSEYRVYSFDKKKQETELIYEIPVREENGILAGVSSNGRKLILNFNNRIVLVDLLTQTEKKLYSEGNDYIAVYGQDLLCLDKEGKGVIYRQNLKTGEIGIIDGINASKFALYEDCIYYVDEDNEGYVSIYNMKTGESERTTEKTTFGFFIGEDGIELK